MRKRVNLKRRGVLAAAVAVVAVGVAGYAYGAVTDTSQVYTGCLSKGTITSVSIGDTPLAACKKDDTQISWSQTGPQGIQGEKGDPGIQGIQGLKGDTGATGPSGLSGFQVVEESETSGTSAFTSAIAECPAGKRVIGGAFSIQGVVGNDVGTGPRVIGNQKWNQETWIVQVVAPSGYSPLRTYSVTSMAHCVNA